MNGRHDDELFPDRPRVGLFTDPEPHQVFQGAKRFKAASAARREFGPPVRERDPETAVKAAKRTREHKSRLRSDILIEHQLHPSGLTDDELVRLLDGEDRGVVARRRLDLVREGLLEDSGHRRPTRTGSPAIVWRLR